MSIDHNRIKVADLELNLPNKILTTDQNGQLEFSNISDIKIDSYNALDYTVEGKALDARQGKVLKDLIASINTLLVSDNIDLNTLQKLVDAIEVVQNSLNSILVNDLTSGGTSKALTAEMGKALQNNKVDKVAGKNLLSDAEITRLATLSNYTHPANHPASIIIQDSSNRFVSDSEKAIWNAKQAALGFVPENASNKNVASGYAGLGTDGKLISSQLPSITVNDTFVVASQAAMLALSVETGDIAVRTDLNKSFILKGSNPSLLSEWQELLTPTSAVTTVFGRNGAITSQTGDYTADQITETAGRKFQSASQQAFNDATSSIQTQLNGKASSTGSGASGTWPINVTGNANTIGGLLVHSGTNNEPNKIVRTDSNGYIQAGWINTVSGDSGASPINRIYASGDQYLRYYTPANFISTLGLATTATNRWYDGWITAPGYDANTIAENKSGFSYSNNCPLSGQLIHFGSGGYSLQLNSNYGSGIADVRFRTHNGDNATWGSWGRFITDGNYNSYSPTLTGEGANGTWGININGSAAGSAKYVDLLPNRTDVAAYPVLWGVNQFTNPVTGNQSTYAFSCEGVKIQSSTGTIIANNFSGSATGLTGTAGSLSIGGNASTSTAAQRISFYDGPRTLSDRLPNSFARTVNFDFVGASTIGGSGNYGGVMTFAPWDGLSSSTGDSSYQLAFRNESGINGSGLPGLRLRKGIDTSWGGWYDMLHSGNYSNFSTFSGVVSSGSGFQTAAYATSTRNRIWSFGNSDGHGLSYFQGTAGWKGTDSIGFHFGNPTDDGSLFKIGNDGATQGLSFKTTANVSGKSLLISGTTIADATTATVYVSNGNLHIDPTNGSAIYLGYYSGTGTNFGNGNNIVTANISASGVFTGAGVASSSTVSAAQYFHTASVAGNGYGFWGGNPNTFGILMSDAGNGNYGGRIAGETSSDYNMYFSMAQGVNRGFIFRNAVNTPLFAIHDNGVRASNDIIAFSSSDERLKDNITKISNPIEKLSKINGYMFDWNSNQNTHEGHDIGVIAQEIESIIPEIVTTRENGFKAVKYDKLVPLLIEVAKTQQTQIEEQQQTIESLNEKIKSILEHLNLKK